ncbi:GNAT family N-acetyltransferase [Nanoarchaeota archaeon]
MRKKKAGDIRRPGRCLFRKFRISDMPQIMSIEKEAFPDPLAPLVVLFLSAMTEFIVVVKQGRVVGFLSLGYENRTLRHIYRIAFSSSCRGQGLGGIILSRYVKNGCSVMTNATNKGSLRFYEKNGFRETKRIKKKSKSLVYLLRS